jgi:hypothetical protein
VYVMTEDHVQDRGSDTLWTVVGRLGIPPEGVFLVTTKATTNDVKSIFLAHVGIARHAMERGLSITTATQLSRCH